MTKEDEMARDAANDSEAASQEGALSPLCETDCSVEDQKRLLKMANANAWLNVIAATMNHDIQKYGEWRGDYSKWAVECQEGYDEASNALSL